MANKTKLTTDIYDQNGTKIEQVELPAEVFGVKINTSLMAQAVRVYLVNQRRGTAHAKTRSEVSGGGRKPWRQKGTGRARHGSIRSPIWVKGGIAHGPVPKHWSLKLSKKMKKRALFSALSEKYINKKIKLIDRIEFQKAKTKKAIELLKKLNLEKSVLIVLPERKENCYLSFRNLPKVDSVIANQINTYTVLNHEDILIEKEAINTLEKTFLKEKKSEDKNSGEKLTK